MKVFWSWQSDTPGKTGRHFIRDALDAAVAALKRDSSVLEPKDREALHVDQDRQGVSGSRDLFPEIVKKIVGSDIFVADVTPVGFVDANLREPNAEQKKLINSNVAIELGFAFQALGDGFVLLVLNNHYGRIEELPFDLRHKGGIISFSLPPGASKDERARVEKMLAKRLIAEIELCASVKAPATAPSGLIAIGPDVVCYGEVIGVKQAEWSIHLTGFIIGDVNTLIRYVDEFKDIAPMDRYIAVNTMGDGRRITAPPSLTKQRADYIVHCAIAPAAPRIAAQQMPRDFSLSPITNDLHLKGGDIATVSGVEALPQRIRSALSLIMGESSFEPTMGSRLQEFYWRYKDQPWLEELFALEIIRLAAIPHNEARDEKRPPLLCIERVQSVKILSADPVNDRLPVRLELDVKGLGIWQHETEIFMPPFETVERLSLKGASMGLYAHDGPSFQKGALQRNDRQIERNRKRLSVVTKHHKPTGLKLEIRYEPESLHIGLNARVTLLDPAHAALAPGVAEVNPAPTLSGYVIFREGQPSADGTCSVKMQRDMLPTKMTLMAIFFVVPSVASTQSIAIAKVRIQILTDVGELLTENEIAVSPIR